MSYWSNDCFRQGGYLWLKNIRNRQDGLRHKKTPKNSQSFHYLSLPVLTPAVSTSTSSMPAICLSQNVWAKTKPSAGYTAKPVAGASVSGKARLWKARSYPKKPSSASSSASDTAAPSKLPQTSAKWTHGRWSTCWKRPAKEQRISIGCNLTVLKSPRKLSRWMNYTLVWLKGQKRGETHCWFASQNGSHVGSRSVGGGKSLYYRPACWPTHPGVGQRTGCIGGCLLWQNPPSAYSYRRAFALSSSYLACLWTNQTSQTQEGSWSKMQTHSQASVRIAGRSSKEAPRCQRQPAEGYYRCSVRSVEEHRETYPAIGHWPEDKYFSSGTGQWDIARSTDASGQAYSQRLASTLDVAMGIVAVAGFVQLGQGSQVFGWLLSCDGFGFGQACLDGSGIYSLSYACQRSPATPVGRAAKGRSGISSGCLST